MATIREFFQNLLYQVPAIGISDIVDILVVSIIFYSLLRLIRSTSAARVARAILLLLAITLLTDVLNLYTLNWLLNKILEVGAIALIIVFQPELRRALEHIGRGNLFSREFFGSIIDNGSEDTVREMHQAITDLAKRRVGALIVIEQRTGLGDIINTGTLIEGRISAPLIENIFEPNTPLHDGAMIIRNNEIVAAACILPLVEDIAVARELGTRHRAGLGISSVSDSITIIVSEETGVISMARDGKLVRYIDSKALRNLLESIFIHKEREFQMPSLSSFRRRKGNQK